MPRFFLLGLVTAFACLYAGCGPNCQSTCNRLYGNGEGNCGITRQGSSQTDLMNWCLGQCKMALEEPGELEGYDPDVREGSSSSVLLDNEKKAAVWMDCIAETSCCDLGGGEDADGDPCGGGYCAPVW